MKYGGAILPKPIEKMGGFHRWVEAAFFVTIQPSAKLSFFFYTYLFSDLQNAGINYII